MDAATLPAPPRAAHFLDRVFDVYFRHPLPLLLFSALDAATYFALESWSEGQAGAAFPIVSLLIGAMVSCAGSFAATRIVRAERSGESVNLAPLFAQTGLGLPRVLGVLILYLLGFFGSLLLLIVPGIVFAISAGFAFNVVAATSINGWGAIRRSRTLVRGRWWRTFARVFLLILPVFLLSMFFDYLPKGPALYWLEAAISALFYPICFVGQAVMYFDLEDHHAVAEAGRARALAAAPAPAAPAAAAAPAYAAPSHAAFDAGAFSAFEHRGWQRAATAYHEAFGKLTRQAADPLLDAAGVTQGTTLLDVGTGPGFIAGTGWARGARVIGVDFSPAMLAVARANHPGVEFRVADAEALPFPDQSFDAVTMGFLIGHLGHPDRAIAEARRVLRPARRFSLSWWQPFDRAVVLGILYDAVRAHGRTETPLPQGPPFDQFSEPDALAQALVDAGFADVQLTPLAMTWRMASGDEVFEAFLHGSVRTAGLLREQTAEQLLAIRAEVVRRAEEYRDASGILLPTPCWVASGLRSDGAASA